MKIISLASLVALALLYPLTLAATPAPDDAKADRAGQEYTGQQYTERMATEHAHDTPEASPAAQAEPAAEVTGERVVYATIEGKEIEGYLAQPANPNGAPGMLVIHEWWGLNENVEAMARRLAGEGYRALAVDLYEGGLAQDPSEARSLMSASMERTPQLLDNLRQAHAYLTQLGAERIGSIGWCFGGGWSLQSAIHFGDQLDATVIYYGRLTSDAQELAKIEAPVLGLFGSEDRGIPIEGVRAFEAAMQGTGKSLDLHIYDGADHAFANPSGQRYDAEAAADAWAKTTTFLATHLKP